MAKRLNYEIGFKADTTQLRGQLKEVASELNKIANFDFNEAKGARGITVEMQQASAAARDLQLFLQRATDVNTGKLDLSKFREQIKNSKLNLQDYATRLVAIGPEGRSAFMQVAEAIGKAEAPTRRLSLMMNELWVTMKNTMRWQLTSSALHGFMSALSNSYNYAKDLNTSLTNIRIVSDQNAEQMKDFAKYANEAAKALSSTTVKYTDAALIYYQQGLIGDAVTERTDTTIKMANVTGDAVEEVSNQLTAIWNNFYDGTKSLEYYADVITALGAATASSTAEISEGLEKYASIAQTIGLSYEYATTSLATIVAQTRQTPETVGTALKTIFARIQGLQLGETMDDGTNLNKYSNALAKVGINIFEQNGQLKDMDALIDELGNKWDTLNKAQQMALAQTVAGVRQYTQLVALLDNYSDFQKNLEVATNSEGELNRQAEIYEESWVAASRRVKAAAEGIYDSILNDEAFITLLDGTAFVLDGIEELIDGFGGLQGVIAITGAIFTKVFKNNISDSVNDAIYNTKKFFGITEKENYNFKQQAADIIASGPDKNLTTKGDRDALISAYQIQIESNKKLSQYQADRLNGHLEEIKSMNALAEAEAKAAAESRARTEEIEKQNNALIEQVNNANIPFSQSNFITNETDKTIRVMTKQDPTSTVKLDTVQDNLNVIDEVSYNKGKIDSIIASYENYEKKLKQNTITQDEFNKQLEILNQELTDTGIKTKKLTEKGGFSELKKLSNSSEKAIENLTNKIRTFLKELQNSGKITKNQLEEIEKGLNERVESNYNTGSQEQSSQIVEGMATAGLSAEELKKISKEAAEEQYDMGWAIGQTTQAIANMGIAITAVQSLGNIFSNEDLTNGEKLIYLLTTLGMLVPSLVELGNILKATGAALTTLSAAETLSSNSTLKNTIIRMANALAIKEQTDNINEQNKALDKNTQGINDNNDKQIKKLSILGRITKVLNKLPVGILGKFIVAIAAVAAVIGGTAWIVDKLITTEEEANKAVEDATTAYQKEKEKLDSLNESLENTNDRITELLDKDSLTIVEQEELNKLKQEQAFLETQVKLQEAIAKAKQESLKAELENPENQKASTRWTNAPLEGNVYREFIQNKEDGSYRLGSVDDWYNSLNDAEKEFYRNDYVLKKQEEDKRLNERTILNAEKLEQLDNDYKQYVDAAYADNIISAIEEETLKIFQTALAKGRSSALGESEYYSIYIEPILENKDFNLDLKTLLNKSDGEITEYIEGNSELLKFMTQLGISAEEFENQIFKIKGQLGEDFDQLSTEKIKFAMSLSPESYKDINELKELYEKEHKVKIQVDIENINQIKPQVAKIIQESNKNQDVSNEDLTTLMGQEAFVNYLDEMGINNEEQFRTFSLEKQLEIVNTYYKVLSDKQNEYYNNERDKLTQQADILKKIFTEKVEDAGGQFKDYFLFNQDLLNLANDYKETIDPIDKSKIKERFNDILQANGLEDLNIDIADFDDKTLNNALSEISQKIEEINEKQIEINISWDNYDTVLSEVNQLRQASNDLRNDAEKMGNSYIISQEKYRKYIEIYPELYKAAKVYEDGRIALDAIATDEIIDNQKDEVNSRIQANIVQLTLDKQKLLNELAIIEQQGEINADSVEGQANLAYWLTKALEQEGLDRETAEAQLKDKLRLIEGAFSQYLQKVNQINNNNYFNALQLQVEDFEDSLNDRLNLAQEYQDNLALIEQGIEWGYIGQDKGGKRFLTESGRELVQTPVDQNIVIDIDGEQVSLKDFLSSLTNEEINLSDKETSDAEEKLKEELVKAANKAKENEINRITSQIETINGQLLIFQGLQKDLNSADFGLGKASESNKEIIKQLEEIAERYHEITREIEYQEKLLKETEEATNRAYGLQKLQGYKKQIESLNKLIEKNNEKLLLAKGNLAIDTFKLEELGLTGLNIDPETLEIANYTEIWQSAQDELNKYLETYNNLSKAEQENRKQEKEEKEKLWEDQKKAFEQYEKTLDTLRDLQAQDNEYRRQVEDTILEEINYNLKIKLDIKDAKKELRDFIKAIEESFGDALTHGLKVAAIDFQNIRDIINDTDTSLLTTFEKQQESLFKELDQAKTFSDKEKLIESLKSLRGEIIATGESLLEWLDNLETVFPDALNAAGERFQVFTNTLTHNTSILQTVKELITLQGLIVEDKKLFAELDKMAQSSKESSLGQARLEKLRYERASEELLQAQSTLMMYNETDAGYDAAYAKWKALLEETQSAEAAYLQAARDTMNSANEIYTNALEQAAYDFEQILTENRGFDLLQKEYDHFIDEEERYLDLVNESYEINKFQNKVLADAENLSSSVYKDELLALNEEIEKRSENNTLSKYDLEIMEAKYDMLQKQIALEEAQANKSQVNLKRDAQGNWSYVFTTDQDAITKAEQELADAENDYYNIAKEQVKDTSGEIISTWKEMAEEIKEIYEDQTLTVSEREAQIAEIREFYAQKIKDIEQEKQIAINDMTQAGKNSIDDYSNNYTFRIDQLSNVTKDFEEDFNNYIDSMDEALNEYQDTIEEVGDITGTTFEDLKDKIKDTSNVTEDFTEIGMDATDMMWDQLEAIHDQADAWIGYADAVREAVNALRELTSQNIDKQLMEQTKLEENKESGNVDYMRLALLSALEKNMTGATDALNQRKNKIESQGQSYDNYDLDVERMQSIINASGQNADIWKIKLYELLQSGNYDSSEVNQLIRNILSNASAFNTGGYTGEFSNAKLAWLHEKELILNQRDTENILSAVSMMRSIEPTTLKAIEKILDSNINNSINNMTGLISSYSKDINSTTKPLQQQINVTAEFPNATDQNEIREAILGLANYATQFVNKR